ncbi:MAG: dihydrofolate reductase [Parcubacteria group bacterium Gr01-1014_56]|nr:MAG: dihydrofolate reductase [Parcubacteria group bacterium Gr01-1014_56]
MFKPRISIIVSIGKNGVIGRSDKLMWPIPEDLKRFKELTMGHPVIMGRKTFESILTSLGKPLPGRTTIVITRDKKYQPSGAVVTHSLEEALAKAREIESGEIFIGGGAQIYEQALPFVDKLYLTLIDDEKEGDAYFPEYKHLFTKKIKEEVHEHNGLKYRFVDLEK